MIKEKIKPAIIVIIILLITLGPMLYGNLVTKKGGILDDAIIDSEDPYVVMDENVRKFVLQGLKTSEAVTIVIKFEDKISAKDILFIKELTDGVKAAFSKYGILSLSIVPKYHDNGRELLNDPYINPNFLEDIKRNPAIINNWLADIRKDPSVYGLLMGQGFDYAAVIILLPRDYDEIAVFRKMAEFLEKRQIPWYEWFYKTDIHPATPYQQVTLAGWAMARGLMDAALVADILKLTCIGLLIVAVAFYLSLRSKRQALIAGLIILICFAWIRGSIGLIQSFGIELYERVYILFVYTAIIVSGISFVERKFETYNEMRQEFPELTCREGWRKTRPVNGMIGVTALIAILNFGTLYQIGIRGILEVGVLAALGIIYLVILVLWFMPAFHSLIGGEAVLVPSSRWDKLAFRWDKLLGLAVQTCYRLIDQDSLQKFTYRGMARIYLGLTVILAVMAVTIIAVDYVPFINKGFDFLEVKTKPLDYLPNTIVYKASEILNKPGNYGFDRMSFLAMPKDGDDIYNAKFFSRLDDLRATIAKLQNVREVNSVLDTARVIARESYKTELPRNRSEIHDSLQMIEWDLGPLVKEQLWFPQGIVLFTSFTANDSNLQGNLLESITTVARKEFNDLALIPFGKNMTYPQTDKYIREGKPWNVVSSQWIVVVVCAFWIIWRNHRFIHRDPQERRLRAWRTGLIISVPFVFASAVIVLVMVMLRVPLDQATACITALAINAAIDFSLYYVADYQTALLHGKDLRASLQYALLTKGRIIVIDIVLNVLCFAPLMTSTFIPVARMGWIMIVMLLACGFGSLVILPALLPWCVIKKATS